MAGSADSNTNNCYDVFISHRGPDVKKTLASHLYRRLISSGLRVFLDYQELQEGEDLTSQIKGAIRNASAHVAILSPTYAESRWCLDELVLMLETEAPIIPVFHHVKPADLRHTQGDGLYARSLHNLENKMSHDSQPRYSSIDIENWRNALSRVADISGLDLEAFNGDEGELLDNVVKVVFKKGVKTKLNVARHPTGLNEKVEDFERKILLQQHNGRVQIVGITGLGGVGKTTLAKELFNRKSSNYSKSYFLFDIRENAKSSLHFLQSKILRGLLQLDVCIDNKDQGIEILRKQLSDSRVLLVLDDVDDVDQVDALLPVDVFSHDSLILITSRDKEILRRSGIHESLIYKLTGLNTEHSTQLFCSHAFCQPFPQPRFEIMVDKFVRACGGLPLSLKVIGSLLYGNSDISQWEDVLNSLQQALPNEIQKKLQISYNALRRDEQHIFLDIACIFIGEDKDTAIRIWDGSGWNGRQGLQSLQNKCLVEVEVDNASSVRWDGLRFKITMHDHLRDLGRVLAKDSNLPRRIWRGTEDIDDLLQQPIGGTHLRGIRMLRSVYRHEYDEMHQFFSSYDKRTLQLLHIDTESDLSELHSPNLIWLSWHNWVCPSLPRIPMKKLRVLHVNAWKLKTLWQDELQAPLHLRELQIYAPRLTSIPKSIGLLKYLERLVVSFNDIEELPEEFCNLLSLKHLTFHSECMRSLPDSFRFLTNLEYINLSCCSKLERLPSSFGNLIKLKYVNLSRCSKITLSSRSFGNITTLEYIDLDGCLQIEELPSQIAHQLSLETLDLDLPNLKYWPPSATREPSGLEKLALRTPLLKSLPFSLGHDLTNLKHLVLKVCHSLERMPELSGLAKLQILKISQCTELRELPSIETLVSLEVFVVCYCPRLERIRGLAQLTKLREIDVSLSSLQEMLEVENLKSLEKLRAYGCVKLKNIRFSAQLTQLRKLEVSKCSELKELSGLQHLRSLVKLVAFDCVKLKSIQGLAQLTHLQDIAISSYIELVDRPGMNCVIDRFYDTRLVGRPDRFFSPASRTSQPSRHFLSACYLCNRQLNHGKDIYMYRGKAFCSVECRHRQILKDEQLETVSASPPYSRSATRSRNHRTVSASPPYSRSATCSRNHRKISGHR